ncbi:hypothetical protein Tsp_02554 [Trichinella spiralis]|uniref:hypothetical protein n=1 Tax=Trichinella spiralis TaxID=6334 RepID=UPI0001EFB5F0|nr:hypothetical protein Tsp_02554 [Trichinella spiralis]
MLKLLLSIIKTKQTFLDSAIAERYDVESEVHSNFTVKRKIELTCIKPICLREALATNFSWNRTIHCYAHVSFVFIIAFITVKIPRCIVMVVLTFCRTSIFFHGKA